MTNLVKAINQNGIAGTDYSVGTTGDSEVTTGVIGGIATDATCSITAKTAGGAVADSLGAHTLGGGAWFTGETQGANAAPATATLTLTNNLSTTSTSMSGTQTIFL